MRKEVFKLMAIMNNSTNSIVNTKSEKDFVTGIYNRWYVDTLLTSKFPYLWLCTLMLLDIDNFKDINEKYGKADVDKILKEVSEIILTTVGESGIIARSHNHEFIVVIPLLSKRASFILAEKIATTVARTPISLKNEKQSLTISIGTCTFLKEENKISTLDQWVKATENALLKAKTHGKGMVIQL